MGLQMPSLGECGGHPSLSDHCASPSSEMFIFDQIIISVPYVIL